MRILNHFPYLLHGGDFNPEQWRNRGEIILEDFRLTKKAGCTPWPSKFSPCCGGREGKVVLQESKLVKYCR